jgi:hypothetical protein
VGSDEDLPPGNTLKECTKLFCWGQVLEIQEPSRNSRCLKGDTGFHTENPQPLGATIKNLVTTMIRVCTPLV